MDIEVEEANLAEQEAGTETEWDKFRPIAGELETLPDDKAIVLRGLTENAVKSLRSFMRYYFDDEQYEMEQRKQMNGTIKAVITK